MSLLDDVVGVFLVLWETSPSSSVFHNGYINFIFLPELLIVAHSLHLQQHFFGLENSHLNSMRWCLIVVLTWASMISDVEHYHRPIVSALKICLFRSTACFSSGYLVGFCCCYWCWFFLELSELLQSLPCIGTTLSICSSATMQPANALPPRQVSVLGIVSFGVQAFRWQCLSCLLRLCWLCFCLAYKILIASSGGSSFGFYIKDVVHFDIFTWAEWVCGFSLLSAHTQFPSTFLSCHPPGSVCSGYLCKRPVRWSHFWALGCHFSSLWDWFSANGTHFTWPQHESHFKVGSTMLL